MATIATVLLAVGYLVATTVAPLVARNTSGTTPLDLLVLNHVDPFPGAVLGDTITAADRLAWAAGAAVGIGVFWLALVLTLRKGVLAAFLGAWLGGLIGTTAGAVVAAYRLLMTQGVPDGQSWVSAAYGAPVDTGLHWGGSFGLVAALVTAVLAALLRKPADPVAPEPARPAEVAEEDRQPLQAPQPAGSAA